MAGAIGAASRTLEVLWQISLSRELSLVSMEDYMGRKRDATTRVREEHFRLALEAGRIGTWEWDAEAGLLTADDVLQSLFGLPPQEAPMANEVYWARMIPEEVTSSFDAAKAALKQGAPFQMEHRVIRPGGEVAWILSRGRAKNGDPNTMVGVSFEITERKRIEEALRQSETRLKSAVDLVELALYAWDPRTNALEWDARSKAMWGLAPEAPVDMDVFFAGIHPDDRPRVEAAIAACIDPGGDGIYRIEYRVIGITDRVERWVSTYGQTIFDKGQAVGLIGAALDITERKRAENVKVVLIAELQHRTRNLLGVVRSIATQTHESSASFDDFMPRFAGRLAALSRAQGLVTRGERRIVLGELVRQELAAHGADPSDARVRVGGPPVTVPGRAVQTLALVIHELATNAIKHGALKHATGRLEVVWRFGLAAGTGRKLRLDWRESGVSIPPAPVGERRGYGRGLIEQALPYELGAEVSFDITPDGIHCRIELPFGRPGGRNA